MTPGGQMRMLLAKETRALLPIWMACVLIGSVAPFMDEGVFRHLSVLAFGGGMIALGAYSFGHEYVHRTLGLMLTLPTDRRRLFLVKLGVLVSMVLPLAAYASRLRLFVNAPELPWLIAAGTVFLVPTVTMLCRNALAGVMFTAWGSAMLLAAVMKMVACSWHPTSDVERAAFVIWSRVMLVVLAGGAVLGWRLFMRLEWNEGGIEISLPWLAAKPQKVAPAHPLWLLIKKELRLHRLGFSMAALYVVVSAAEEALRLVRPHDLPFLVPVTLGYWLCLPVLIGSVASAEERQLGTLSWQLLLPVPAWQQCAVKVTTAFALALLLGIGVPVLVLSLAGPNYHVGHQLLNVGAVMVQTLALAAAGLYVSSLSRSAVMAGGVSFAAIAALGWLAALFAPVVARPAPHPFGIGYETNGAVAILAVSAGLLVRFAFVNHRSEEPGTARVWRQTMWLTGLVAFAIVLIESRPF